MLASFSAQFTLIDWLVVVAYLAGITWLGATLAGKQSTIREFFLGGRKLPWYAVSGAIIATEISALTFVSVPWVVFQPGGNFTYFQLGLIGVVLARMVVAYVLVPAYYEREIYSPYDYMGHQLGGRVRGMTTLLFTISGMLAQSARIYLTAEVVNVILRDYVVWLSQTLGLDPLAWSIIIIAGVSIVWTLMGGMTMVIWTDVILFLAFLGGAIVALWIVISSLDGGLTEFFRVAWNARESGVPWAPWGQPQLSGPAGKFTLFDWSADPTRAYTIWAAAIASTWGSIGAYGTDQLMAQRMFCCRNPREARWAIIGSNVSLLVTLLVMFVGAGLFVFYQSHTPSDEALAMIADRSKGDRIFPIFIVEEVPVGLKGFIVAAIFAAAISSVMGILTALSQTVITAFYTPWREALLQARGGARADSTAEDRRTVLVSRLMVVVWGAVLGLLAYGASHVAVYYKSILDLGLSAAGYVGGALLAGFALSFLPLRIDSRGFMYSAPLSVMCVFALVWHQPWTHALCWGFGGAIMLAWIGQLIRDAQAVADLREAEERSRRATAIVIRDWPQTLVLATGVALMLWLNYFGYWEGPADASGVPTKTSVAFPWQAPVGSTIAFTWGVLLARRRAA